MSVSDTVRACLKFRQEDIAILGEAIGVDLDAFMAGGDLPDETIKILADHLWGGQAVIIDGRLWPAQSDFAGYEGPLTGKPRR